MEELEAFASSRAVKMHAWIGRVTEDYHMDVTGKQMGSMAEKKKYWIIQIFLVIFTVSVSASVLPCGIINVHGLFSEVTASTVVEDKEQEVVNIKFTHYKKVQTVKGANIFNIWFEMLAAAVCISFCANLNKLPRGDTIVTLKVRMDN